MADGMKEKLELNGTLCDAWGSNGTFFIAFDTTEFDPAVLPSLYDLAKKKIPVVLTLGEKDKVD